MKVGVIGTGKMGSAMIKGFALNKSFSIYCYDISKEAMSPLKNIPNVHLCKSTGEVIKNSSIVILAVKPKDINRILKKIEPDRSKIFVSLAAGIPLSVINRAVKHKNNARIMPNLAVEVGKGVIAAYTENDKTFKAVESVLSNLGYFFRVYNEDKLNAITALGGSAPAFVASFIDALSDGGVLAGIDRSDALKIALNVLEGTVLLLKDKNIPPSLFIQMVTSPGGTTIEGISVLEAMGFKASVIEAVRAAWLKAIELSGG